MHITIAACGKAKQGPEAALCQTYLKRLSWPHKIIEIPESRADTAELRKAQEAEKLRAAGAKDAVLIVLSERGKQLGSVELADFLQTQADQGHRQVSFLIGGPDGLDPALESDADLLLAFGKITLPHLLARAVLCEQIYRASTILAGHPYHRV